MSHFSAGNEDGGRFLPQYASHTLPIEEVSRVGEARRMAMSLAARLGFNETELSNLAIVVTEIANNLLHHAGSGEILMRSLEEQGAGGIEVLALDKGPGMASVSRCREDGYSTRGTPGTGLGAIARLSASLDIYSRPGQGTALRATAWAKSGSSTEAWQVGAVNRPKPGELVCGDSWRVTTYGSKRQILVVDGLGHGPDAARASQEAVTCFRNSGLKSPAQMLQNIHAALHGTRGAAVAVASLDEDTQVLTFAGVGNIAAMIVNGESSRSLVSHYGIVGFQVQKIQEFTYPCPTGSLLIFNSDGLATGRTLEGYLGLADQAPALIAGILYRDFQRLNDDSTVIVARATGSEGRTS